MQIVQRSTPRIVLALVVLVTIAVLRFARDDGPTTPEAGLAPARANARTPAKPAAPEARDSAPSAARRPEKQVRGNDALLDAWRNRRSDLWVEGSGTVEALLPDDREGSRHQKFIVRVDRELTVLVSHNIDLAPRVPLDRGDAVSFRGEYVWNGKGGLVHWTHHDPRGPGGGWIRLGHEVYE